MTYRGFEIEYHKPNKLYRIALNLVVIARFASLSEAREFINNLIQ